MGLLPGFGLCALIFRRLAQGIGPRCATPLGMAGQTCDILRHETKSEKKRESAMKENDFQARLANLLEQIETLPESDRPKLAQLATETQSRHQRMKKTIVELQDSLDHLRLSVKYLVFDLEATRRENKYLRNMLDNNAEGAD